MTSETQRESTIDLFAAFAIAVAADPDDVPVDEIEVGIISLALSCLMSIDTPLSGEVLQAIHAERRRRLSAATREERRAS